jgi:RNA polymerase sigma factor (sigma-70 family)
MASGQLSTVLRHLHRLTDGARADDADDAELLERFTAQRDEAAFAALVRRHGPLVLAACRRVLGNAHDAEDAFQAVFLVLVRKAGSIKRRAALGGWLHEVALRVALRARVSAQRRRLHEQRVPDMPRKDFLTTVVWRDLQPVLDEEVQGLPESCREAFVLCYLEGKTYEEAARQLGCRAGTISRRLGRARELLRLRLKRRGLVLPAGVLAAALSQQTAPAAVPAALIASTVKTALRTAAGAIPARIAALAEGGLQAMTASKTKVALALLLTAGLALAGAAALARSTPAVAADPGQAPAAAPQAGAAGTKAPAAQPDARGKTTPADPAQAELTVSGQVVSADGKPVAGANVALLGRAKRAARGGHSSGVRDKTLAAGKTDREGKFRLGAAGVSSTAYLQVILVAGAPGHGIAQERLTVEAGRVTVKLDLPGERVLRGRLVDLQGQPAAGVTVRLESAHGKLPSGKAAYLYKQHAPAGASYWPGTVVSDTSGRFRLAGLPAGHDLTLGVQAEGAAFARQSVEVSKDGPPDKEVTLSLAPGRVLEGTVTYRDTGKPVPDARLHIESMTRHPSGGFQMRGMDARADAKGRYRAVPYEGDTFIVTAYPPAGEPYLLGSKRVEKPRGVVLKQEINVSLRRGVLVRGVVKEAASGKPVAGAFVEFEPRYSNNPFYGRDVRFDRDVATDADGRFATVVLPGPGHLLVNGPTPDYLHKTILMREIYGPDIAPNRRYYPDGLVALDLKPEIATHRVEITLTRGVPLKGRVLGPDGKAVASGHLLCRCYVPTGFDLNGASGVTFKDGRFELPGWDPAHPAPLYVLSPELGAGGVLEVKKGQGDTVRVVDQSGKPLADSRTVIMVPLSPGVSFFDPNGFGGKDATADEAFLSTFDPKNHNELRTDADGRLELRGLIPGARHWIIVTRPTGGMIRVPVDVIAESGKTLDLKDVTVNLN